MSARRTANRASERNPAPAGELAQVQRVGLAGQAAVPGQEPGERDPLGGRAESACQCLEAGQIIPFCVHC